jgi:phosphoenolpyruvate-protein kinase (PTS system EI component)
MLPMVNDLAELRVVRQWLREDARELGIAALPRLGVMIETPAAVLMADQLAREADFLSIGSNDLSQYVLAMDRGHADLAASLDALHPAVLRAIAQVAAAGRTGGCSVSLCGGLASEIEALPLLVGLGLRELSCVPGAVPAVKRTLRELDAAACEALAADALRCESAAEVRALLQARSAPREPDGTAREPQAAMTTGAAR